MMSVINSVTLIFWFQEIQCQNVDVSCSYIKCPPRGIIDLKMTSFTDLAHHLFDRGQMIFHFIINCFDMTASTFGHNGGDAF
jgi:hypothetical protein